MHKVPYNVKRLIFDDIWTARGTARDADGEFDDVDAPIVDSDDNDAAEKSNKKKDKKDKAAKDNKDKKGKDKGKEAKGNKGNKGKKDKNKGKDDKGKKDKGERRKKEVRPQLSVIEPSFVAEHGSGGPDSGEAGQELEPLFLSDYHGSVWAQIVLEWGAKGCILYTPGNGTGACQAVVHEIPTLCLALNPQHAELISYFIDGYLARAIQVHWAGNRLHDAGMSSKIKKVLEGKSSDSDGESDPKRARRGPKANKDNKEKKEKNNKKNVSVSSSSDVSDEGSDEESDEEA